MNQSTFIAAAILAGFVLYLAAQNRLSTYASVLWGATTGGTSSGSTGPSLGSSGAISTGAGSVQIGGSSGQGATTTTPDGSSLYVPLPTP